jgi:hypothetical protein
VRVCFFFFNLFFRSMVTYSQLTRLQEVWNAPFENPVLPLNWAVKTQSTYPITLTLLSLLIHLVGSTSCSLLTDLHIYSWDRLMVTYYLQCQEQDHYSKCQV